MLHDWERVGHAAFRCEKCGIAIFNTENVEAHEIKYVRYLHSDEGYGFFVPCTKKSPDVARFNIQNCDMVKVFLVHTT